MTKTWCYIENGPSEIYTRGPFTTVENGPLGAYFPVVNAFPPRGKCTRHIYAVATLLALLGSADNLWLMQTATFKLNSLSISFMGDTPPPPSVM